MVTYGEHSTNDMIVIIRVDCKLPKAFLQEEQRTNRTSRPPDSSDIVDRVEWA